MHDKRGIALIFNHEKCRGKRDRVGTIKDGDDLKVALEKLNFDVELHIDLKLHEIRKKLLEVSKQDHSKSDCLWVTVMSHGGKNGKIYSSDKHYHVEELWENFLGDKCESLVGKPKMFFIQACRGDKIDPGAVEADGEHPVSKKIRIPQFADLLVMYSTFDLHFAYRHTLKGSWFIQALCEELNVESDSHVGLYDDLMHILARVNRKVASEVKIEKNSKFKEAKQTTYIESTLRKSIIFFNKSSMTDKASENLCYDMSNANRGVALIFNQEFKFLDNSQASYDTDDLKAVLEILQFDVRIYKNLKADEIRKILYEVSIEDHSNNDCLLVIVMTAGRKDGQLRAEEDKYYNVQELWDNFVGDNCKSLIGKPKLFFIDACREKVYMIPKLADLMVMYSTMEGYVGFIRSPYKYGCFIEALLAELKTNLHGDFLSMLTKVNKRNAIVNWAGDLAGKKQMPIIVSMLTKTLCFTPKNEE
ncbi:unnamed protein product [Diamesa hyperborea]